MDKYLLKNFQVSFASSRLCVGFFLCLCLFPLSATAEKEEWIFLPSTPLFEPSIADPQEPHLGITAYLSQNRYEGEVGASFEFLRFKPGDGVQWGWGIAGSGRILLDQYGASFPMQDGDWFAQMFLTQASGHFSHRFEFTHESSHLGDALQNEVLLNLRTPIFYSRESLQLSSSYKPTESLRLTAGFGVWYNIYPEGDPWFASLGAEVYTPYVSVLDCPLRGYWTCHLRWKGESGGTWNKTFQAGVQWKFSQEETRAIRLALVYYSGLSEFGQFYLDQDDHWGIGVYFDP